MKISIKDVFYLRGVLVFLPVAILSAYIFPYLLMGQDGSLSIHDNLDSNYVWYKILVESGAIFSSNETIIPRPLGGIPRSALPSEFDVITWLYVFFDPFGAYVVNRILMILIGFGGMLLLLKAHVIPDEKREWIPYGVSTCFAILPFWPLGGLSVAGIPLAMYALLNFRGGRVGLANWIILLVFSFYSSLVLSGFFLLASMSFLLLYDIIHKRRGSCWFFFGIAFLAICFVCSHYRLFLGFFSGNGFISHRKEFSFEGGDFYFAAGEAWSILTRGQYHAEGAQRFFILLAVLGAAPLIFKSQDLKLRRLFLLIVGFMLATSIFYGLIKWDGVSEILYFINAIIPIQVDRFYFLHPALWMMLFALALSVMAGKSERIGVLAASLLALQVFYEAARHELWVNRKNPSVKEFYAENIFRKVKYRIARDPSSYRVASLGLHPSIAQFNGFYTIDGYFPNYPLQYKHAFRKIISKELGVNEGLRKYYDGWGSRVYVFSDELSALGNSFVIRSGSDVVLRRLSIDGGAFRRLGGEYIISAVALDRGMNPGLHFMGKLTDPSSAWDIYLYEVNGGR